MLAKINSIKKAQDFKTIFKDSKSLKNSLFVLRARKNGLDIIRFGFVVSQKVSKKATVRNKVKRRLAAAAQLEVENIKKGTDLVLIALPGIEKKDFFEIKKILKDALNKAGLVRED